MSFLYPIFLLAGLSLLVPVFIHLFNLRRYKTVLFPHTRFLRNIELQSRRQSKVRYKWLLLLRLLFLASLVLAFAQPLFRRDAAVSAGRRMQVIYIDNSNSLSLKKGARTLLDVAKESARRRIRSAAPGTRFLLLTANGPLSYQALPVDEAIAALQNIAPSAVSQTNAQVLATVQSLLQTEAQSEADLYYYSDFQRSSFNAAPPADLTKGIRLHAIAVQGGKSSNVYIDTVFMLTPVLDAGVPARMVVRSKRIGGAGSNQPAVQLFVNGQARSAATPAFDDKGESNDTLEFSPAAAGWQRLQVTISDAAVPFDDTFRIAARSAPSLSVLVLNEGGANPYINAAFGASNGFRVVQQDAAAPPADWREYNLVIFQNITRLDGATGQRIATALRSGQNVCIFPGRTGSTDALSEGLAAAAGIRITGLDTALQAATTLQSGADLVRDVFEANVQNVELPTATWHYTLSAGLNANAQSIISFRDGDPLLVQYTPGGRGRLFLSSTSADDRSGNFPASYFFAPFLYQMALQSSGTGIYVLTSGRQQSAYLPLRNSAAGDDRRMLHLRAPGIDAIPPQRPAGAGVEVFVDAAVKQPGFYALTDGSTPDSTLVALNADRAESALETWDMGALRSDWKGPKAEWLKPEDEGLENRGAAADSFPWWKLCAALAILWLLAETALLTLPVLRTKRDLASL